MNILKRTLPACLLSFVLLPSHAATVTQSFSNRAESNLIYIWMDDASSSSIDKILNFGGDMRGWTVQSNDGATLVMSGATVQPGKGTFHLKLSHVEKSVSFQWAEVFFESGVSAIRSAGSSQLGAGRWTSSDTFTRWSDVPNQRPSEVPLPASLALLLSAALALGAKTLRRS